MIIMINDRFYNEQEIRQLIASQAEQITKLKKLLLQACSDFDGLSNYGFIECSHYLYNARTCDGCPLNSDSDECKWIYEAEALELIGKKNEI